MNVVINGIHIDAPEGSTILEAAKLGGICIPTLCHLEGLNERSVCRICVVSVEGQPNLMPACSTVIRSNMVIETENEAVLTSRRKTLELLCSDHSMDCTDCPRGANCAFRELCRKYGANDLAYGKGARKATSFSDGCIVRDNSRCLLCRRCESVCTKLQGINGIYTGKRAAETEMLFGAAFDPDRCVRCGQCAAVCPTGALSVFDDTKKTWKALLSRGKTTVVALSPYACRRIGEYFGEAEGKDCGKKLAAFLRKIGFDTVIDVGAHAQTYRRRLMEAAAERKGTVPLITGTCPAWRKLIEQRHPQFLQDLLPENGLPRELAEQCRKAFAGKDVFFVSIGNCLAAKTEDAAGMVDQTLTTAELFQLLRRACVSDYTLHEVWKKLPEEDYDILPDAGESAAPMRWKALEIREEQINGKTLRVMHVSGLGKAQELLSALPDCDLIDVRACPGGCFNGGGTPISSKLFDE